MDEFIISYDLGAIRRSNVREDDYHRERIVDIRYPISDIRSQIVDLRPYHGEALINVMFCGRCKVMNLVQCALILISTKGQRKYFLKTSSMSYKFEQVGRRCALT